MTTNERVYEYIEYHWKVHGFPPSFRDIMAGCGLKSTSTVKHHLDALEGAGRIVRAANKSRAIVLRSV